MNSDPQFATGRMKMGIRRLLDLHPLFGGLLSRWVVREGKIPTMGVMWDNHRITLIYSPEFVLGLKIEELQSVLMHEVRHVLYGHCTMLPEDWPNKHALVVAQEVTVNENLTNLPGGCIILANYPMLEPGTDTHERYAILAPLLDPKSAPDQQLGEGLGTPSSGTGSAAHEPTHHPWGDFAANSAEAEADLRSQIDAVLRSGRDMGPDAGALRKAVEHLKKTAPGWMPGDSTVQIGASSRLIRVAELRHLLLGLTGTARRKRLRYGYPPRRMPHLAGLIPSRRSARQRIRVNAVIDTSASMDEATLASIAAILRLIEGAAELTVVECDAAIHRVYPFNGAILTVTGRGGTNFRPPLERAFLEKTRAEAVVYFTDGLGRPPAKPPKIPVIWALTRNGTPPTEWGKVLEVES